MSDVNSAKLSTNCMLLYSLRHQEAKDILQRELSVKGHSEFCVGQLQHILVHEIHRATELLILYINLRVYTEVSGT